MPKSPDDLEALKEERAAADRAYNDALTRLDRAIQQLPADFPRPPSVPDEHQVTPYVDTRDRDVAGLLRGLSGAINGVADEVLKRSEATLARDRRHEQRVESLESAMTALRDELAALQRRGRADG